eukprot:CAMPEP_0196573754 /NCGR_PEP_ID=MMETSP1081-20130531/3603_1 /TAXON_ID=36882 /ORGANISM="Pyramimonas amylifera, Strain CCMP720" /LENGTH=139 /DNA_ID=CAMNT_0041891577 /DNA_START=229 /DNA_END=648 /DNA_ORIENTATION=-
MAILHRIAPDCSLLSQARNIHSSYSEELFPRIAKRVVPYSARSPQYPYSTANVAASVSSPKQKSPIRKDGYKEELELWGDLGDFDMSFALHHEDQETSVGNPQHQPRKRRQSLHERIVAEKSAQARAARARGHSSVAYM